MRQLINTACFPPRRVLWQQPKDSSKAGQGSLSKVPLSPNNVTNSVLTWMLLREVPETGKITQLIKLAVRKPSAKCRDTLPTPAVGVQPPWSWDPLGRRGSSHLPAPWAGVCSEWGHPGKEPPEALQGCISPPRGFPGELTDSHLEKAEHRGLPSAPMSPGTGTLLGRGSVRALLWAVPAESGTARHGLAEGTSPCTAVGDPRRVSPRGSLFFNTSLLVGLSV